MYSKKLAAKCSHLANLSLITKHTYLSQIKKCYQIRSLSQSSVSLTPSSGGSTNDDQKGNIIYAIVPREKSKVISSFLRLNYHAVEPITVALEMNKSELDVWFKRFIRMCMFVSLSDISVQAIDEKRNKRVGVLSSIIIDPKISRPTAHEFTKADKHPVNTKMNEFFSKVEQGLDPAEMLGLKKEGTPSPRILEHLYVSVVPEYAGQGISAGMIRLAESLAVNTINCRIGYVISTSEYSHKAFENQGYKALREIIYEDYVDSKGEKIFAGKNMQPHRTCKALAKELAASST